MSLANSSTHYGAVSKTFHWMTALLILTAFPLGMIANGMPYDTGEELAAKAFYFSMHKTVGVLAFIIGTLSIFWAVTQPKPGLLHSDRPVESFAAEAAHWLLYISLVIVPLSGWIHHAATAGFAPIWWPFGQDLPLVPKNETLAGIAASIHFVVTKVLALTIFAHIAGALKHHIIDKDNTLRRMLPGLPKVTVDAAHGAARTPFVTASVIYLAALTGGTVIGMNSDHGGGPANAAVALAEVSSGWTVETGSLGISVTQMGSDVGGEFADWTASIEFSEDPTDGRHGTVEVTIAIGSLTLGSVTDQALGADFFDASSFPTAVYTADILPGEESAYVAEGLLTLKGVEVPVTLNFDLQIDGDLATMAGTTTLDRRDYNIGETYRDESSVAFLVGVNIELTAQRAE